jgi:hypothetical protein
LTRAGCPRQQPGPGVFLAVSLTASAALAPSGTAGTLLAVLPVQTALAVAASRLAAFRLPLAQSSVA